LNKIQKIAMTKKTDINNMSAFEEEKISSKEN